MSLEKLREECEARGCSQDGSKGDLVQRLVDCEREAGWPGFVPSSPTSSPKKKAPAKKKASPKQPSRTSSSGSPRQQGPGDAATVTDSASEGDPPESLAAVVKMAELTTEQLSIAVEKSEESAFTDTDADGRTPLHHLCERRWGLELISTLVAKAPQAATMTDTKGKTPLACLLAGPAAGKHFGDDGCKTDKEWGQHLRKVLTQKGAPLRAVKDHEATRSIAEGDLGKWTGEGRSEQCQVNWTGKGSSWVPWQVVEPAVERVERPVTTEMVACLCSVDEGLISTQDKSGSLPVQLAIDSKLSADVVDYLRTTTTDSPAVWFSSTVEDSDATKSTFHLLIHTAGSHASGAEDPPKNCQLPGALEALSEDPCFAASTTIRGLPFAVDDIDSVCCGPKHLAMLLQNGTVYRSGIRVRQSTMEKLAGTAAQAGAGKSPALIRLEQAEKKVAAQTSKITEMRDRLRQLETQKYDVDDDDPLIEMLASASEKSPDDVKAALGRFPAGPQRGELAFNVLFGTQVFGTGDEQDVPPDADQAGVQRFQIKKEEQRLAELEVSMKPLRDAVEEVQGGSGDSADIMLSLSALEPWPAPPCEFDQVSATLSELVARGKDGSVHRWKWDTEEGEPHPSSPAEPVSRVVSSSTRVTLLTASGKLCTWLDASLWSCRGEEKQEASPGIAEEGAEEVDDKDDDEQEDQTPMLLHDLCGRNVQVIDDNTRAKKSNGYNNATVFTALPVAASRTGERRFEVLIEKHGNSYSGSIRIGFTATDPSSLPRVETESYSIARSWVLDGSSIHSASRSGTRETYPSVSNMKTDSRIAAIVDADGGLRFEFDGVDQGLACGGLPPGEDLWGIIDLYGQCDQIALVGGAGSAVTTPDSILEKLEHSATAFSMDSKVQSVAVSNKGSCAATASGSVYWWGQRPWGLRLQSFGDRQAANTAADFDKAFDAYIKTVDDKQMLCSKSEMTALLASESSFRERLRRAGSMAEKKKEKRQLKAGKRVSAKIGPESPQGKALQHLKDVYKAAVDKVKVGDTVVISKGNTLYAKQSAVIVEDESGFPVAYRLRKSADTLDAELELVGYQDAKATVKIPMQSATLVSREVCADQAEVVQMNKAKGVAVLRSLKDDELTITDLVTLVAKQALHDDCEALQQTPLCIFDEEKLQAAVGEVVSLRWGSSSEQHEMSNYYTAALEPTLCDHYNTSRRVFTAKSVSVVNWTVSVTVADEENCLFQYNADLENGKWEFMPVRHVHPDGDVLKAQRWGTDASSKALLEIDEECNVCNGPSLSLPPIRFGTVASCDCDGSSVSVMTSPVASSDSVGDVVTVSPTYTEHDDAEQGPLKPGQTGTIDRSDGSRLRIKADHDGKTWWYFPAALQLTKSVPPILSIVALGLGPRAAPEVDDGTVVLSRSTSRKLLHNAATGSESLPEMLAMHPDESLRRLLAARDTTGATAFMCAMRRADLEQAAAIASTAKQVAAACPDINNNQEEMLFAADINRDTPLHALLGLGTTKVDRVEFESSHLGPLSQILDEAAVGISTQRNVAGQTALQTYILQNGLDSTTRWTVVNQGGVNIRGDASFDRDPIGRLSPGDKLVAVQVKTVRSLQWIELQNPSKHGVPAKHKKAWVLVKKGPTLLEQTKSPSALAPEELVNAICQCTSAVRASLEVPPEIAADQNAALEWRDCFAYGLVSCGQTLAASFSRSVRRLFDSSGSEDAKLGKHFCDAAARVFVALLAPVDVSKDTASLRKVFSAVFHELGGHAIQSLASIAALSVQSVRLGMPIPQVEPAMYKLAPTRQDLKTDGDIEELLPPPPPAPKETAEKQSSSREPRHGGFAHSIGENPSVVGQKVTVVDDFDDAEEYDDAQDGPLEPGEDGVVEKITGSRYLVRPVDPEEGAPSTWWYDQAALVVTGGPSRSRDANVRAREEEAAKDEAAVVARARMFHLCLVTITTLGKTPALARTTTRRFSASPGESVQEGETDTALLLATSLLQPAWAFVYESCAALEEMLQTEARAAGCATLKLCEQLRGQRNELNSKQFRHIALMLDALVRLKQALPVLEASDTEVDAPELRGLVRSISHLQLHPPTALRDAWSTLRRDELLESLQRLSDEEGISHAEGRDLRRSPLLWFLFRHRKTIEMLASIPATSGDPVDQESFLNVLEPYEKKQSRVHQRMSVRRTSIPEDRPTLKLAVPRGQGLLEELFKLLKLARAERFTAAAGGGSGGGGGNGGGSGDEDGGADDVGEQDLPLCRKLECSYVGEPGEGSGMTRMVVTDVTKSLRAAEGAGAGLFRKSPLVTTTDAKWWEKEPMGRVVPDSVEEGADDGEEEAAAQLAREEREERLRAVGNVIGLCLLHGVKFPLFFCRHVYKAMLGRKVNYADYAYFDPSNHSMLLSMVRDAASMDAEEDMMLAWDETVGFATLGEGDEAPPVTPSNVHAYVLRKAHFDMVDCVSAELAALVQGLHDVIVSIHVRICCLLPPCRCCSCTSYSLACCVGLNLPMCALPCLSAVATDAARSLRPHSRGPSAAPLRQRRRSLNGRAPRLHLLC